MQTSRQQTAGLRDKIRHWFQVAGLLFWGIGVACFFGERLLEERDASSPWQLPLLLLVPLCWIPDWRRIKAKADDRPGCLLWLYLCFCWAALYFVRQRDWAPPAAGVVTGAYIWMVARMRRRSWAAAVTGCLLAGAAVRLVPWPNAQRVLVVFVCFGLSVALQGGWEIVRYLQGRRPEPGSTPPPEASGEGLFLRFLHLIFGRLEFVQIVSPSVDLRLRTRYQAAIAEIAGLGFDHLCSYGETFSAFRLLFVLPAIVILSMWRNREVIRLYEGTRIQACYPLLISRDKTTYADANGDGVKFYTAFTDGTFLVSGTYVAGRLEKPNMTRHCRVASIREIWTEHRSTIEAFEAGGRRVNRRTDFQTFVDMSQRETAPV